MRWVIILWSCKMHIFFKYFNCFFFSLISGYFGKTWSQGWEGRTWTFSMCSNPTHPDTNTSLALWKTVNKNVLLFLRLERWRSWWHRKLWWSAVSVTFLWALLGGGGDVWIKMLMKLLKSILVQNFYQMLEVILKNRKLKIPVVIKNIYIYIYKIKNNSQIGKICINISKVKRHHLKVWFYHHFRNPTIKKNILSHIKLVFVPQQVRGPTIGSTCPTLCGFIDPRMHKCACRGLCLLCKCLLCK